MPVGAARLEPRLQRERQRAGRAARAGAAAEGTTAPRVLRCVVGLPERAGVAPQGAAAGAARAGGVMTGATIIGRAVAAVGLATAIVIGAAMVHAPLPRPLSPLLGQLQAQSVSPASPSQPSQQSQPSSVPPSTPTFRTRGEGVRIDVLVTDRERPVAGLTTKDFALTDHGIAQTVEAASLATLPLDIILVLDLSVSLGEEGLQHLARGADALLARLKPEDRAALVTFSQVV